MAHDEESRTRQRSQPDVVLFDVATFTGTSAELEAIIAEYSAKAPVLVLARQDRIEQIIVGFRAGAVGLIKQVASDKELRSAIMALAEGNAWCDAKLFKRIMQFVPAVLHSKQSILTKREIEVLQHISLGRSNKEIAQDLRLTVGTVKVYVSSLLRKTGAPNRNSLALYAITGGIVQTAENG